MDNNSHPYSFRQSEHLKLRKAIAAVFMQNNVLRSGPIKLIYAIEPAEAFDYQVAFVAPKKVHHLAVDRNRYKRLMREAFRLNKQILTADADNKPAKITFLLVAQNSRPMQFSDVEADIRRLLASLSEKVTKTGANL